jgi:hypothetical protein
LYIRTSTAKRAGDLTQGPGPRPPGHQERPLAGSFVERVGCIDDGLEALLLFGSEHAAPVTTLKRTELAPVRPGLAGGWVRAGCAILDGGHEDSPFVVRASGCATTCGAISVSRGTLTQVVKVLNRFDYLFPKSFGKLKALAGEEVMRF